MERWWQNWVKKKSVMRIRTSGDRLTLSLLHRLPPTTIYNLAIRQLTPVHVKRKLPVTQLQFSLCGGSPLLTEHRGDTGSGQNLGWSSYERHLYCIFLYLTETCTETEEDKPSVGTDPLAAITLCLIEIWFTEAQHTYTLRFLIKPLIKYQLCRPWKLETSGFLASFPVPLSHRRTMRCQWLQWGLQRESMFLPHSGPAEWTHTSHPGEI